MIQIIYTSPSAFPTYSVLVGSLWGRHNDDHQIVDEECNAQEKSCVLVTWLANE